jgi:hypothetical protein
MPAANAVIDAGAATLETVSSVMLIGNARLPAVTSAMLIGAANVAGVSGVGDGINKSLKLFNLF